ncbi:MAG TPA: hypothetical protein VJJ98_02650 [Sedimentisphaerales bacterium]|nr:hypothetical protein [Sedimentisphaerales bacterium]
MEKWLDCTISPGQFTGEFAVQGKMFDATEFSLFAPKEDLKFTGEPPSGKPVRGFIRVILGPRKDNLLLVTLPQPTFENGRTITVKADQIRDQ